MNGTYKAAGIKLLLHLRQQEVAVQEFQLSDFITVRPKRTQQLTGPAVNCCPCTRTQPTAKPLSDEHMQRFKDFGQHNVMRMLQHLDLGQHEVILSKHGQWPAAWDTLPKHGPYDELRALATPMVGGTPAHITQHLQAPMQLPLGPDVLAQIEALLTSGAYVQFNMSVSGGQDCKLVQLYNLLCDEVIRPLEQDIAACPQPLDNRSLVLCDFWSGGRRHPKGTPWHLDQTEVSQHSVSAAHDAASHSAVCGRACLNE
jgi:hypothetical protein